MSSALLLSLLGLLQTVGSAAPLTVAVDSARRTVTFTYRVPEAEARATSPGHQGIGHGAHHGHAHIERMERARWPVSGWIRGARVDLVNPTGEPLPQSLLHHANLVNFERAQLVHPGVERVWGAGQETGAVMLPAGVGVPMSEGTRVGLIVAFVPGDLPAGAEIRVAFRWTPLSISPRPVNLLPVSLTQGFRTTGTSAYDLPAGRSERSFEFVMPLSGRVIGAGGHLHDHGAELRLEDVESGKVIIRLRALRSASGRIEGVERRLFGVTGNGRRLRAGTRLRLVVTYDNPTGTPILQGAMGSMALGFVPDSLSDWPSLDPEATGTREDLAHLATFERLRAATTGSR